MLMTRCWVNPLSLVSKSTEKCDVVVTFNPASYRSSNLV